MYLPEIIWLITWPALIYLSYYIVTKAVQKMDDNEE